MVHRCAIRDSKQRMKDDDTKVTDGYPDEDLHECCAGDCREAGKHLLILKEWAGTQYGEEKLRQALNFLLLALIIVGIIWLRN
jgi:hypothetical protein